MKGIVKEFPGVKALDGVDFELKSGEVHALLGINGAGKSTLIKILSGVYQKDAGSIYLDDNRIEINNAQDAIKHGIATVYQDPQMISTFTGYENIYLGSENEKKGIFSRINRKKLREKAEKLLERFPVDIDLTRPVIDLSAIEKEIIAVLRALSKDMSVLVLDEPTSILTEKETEVLFSLIRLLKDRGVSIIYITHRLKEIYQIADRLTVLQDGKNVATLDTNADDSDNHMAIAELMLGKKLDKVYPERGKNPGQEIFSIKDLSLNGTFRNVNFSVRKGEIVGIFGLVGSGAEELSKVLFGVIPKTSGTFRLNDREIRLRSSSEAIEQGIFLIPGDRRQEGQISDEPVFFNVSLSNLKKISGLLGLIHRKSENLSVQKLVDQVKVAPRDIHQNVSSLSGGNQQKVVISKGLFSDAEVYIFAEPTVGVDVGSKTGIYNLIRDLADEKGIIIISSDCEEVYGMCDRAIVLYKGEVVMHKKIHDCRLEEMLLCGVTGGGKSDR
jgi:ABC-type sugar transport system ATPase subunit